MTTLASINAGRVATTVETAVTAERNLGVRAAVGLLVHPFAPRQFALDVILRSVERQARMAGCGRVHLEGPREGDRLMASFVCPSDTGPGPCLNTVPHQAPKNCVHASTSGVPDRHDKPGRGDGE